MSAPECWFVVRTLRALELLAVRPRSAPKLADELGVHARTARRILKRLAEQGYVERNDEERTYAPTMKVVALAGQVVERAELAQLGLSYVAKVRSESGAQAHLSVPSYMSALCVVHDVGDEAALVKPQLRELVPAHATASGKALLAYRPVWGEAVIRQPLERHTGCTLTEPDELGAELERVRARGYAIEDGEYQPAVRGVAAPVFSHRGECVAALSATGPEARLNGELDTVAEVVVETAGELSSALGAPEGETAGEAPGG
ncbi:MAG: IclR family transcriptional regulator [Thermoleophilaceae bacterium]